MDSSNLLKEAKNYKKNRMWSNASNLYERYIDNNKSDISAEIYFDYGECLRRLGKTSKAEYILNKIIDKEPDNLEALMELYKLYDSQADWENAQVMINELIKLNSNNSNYYFNLGRTYAFLNNYDDAKQCYKKGLEIRHGSSLDKVISEIVNDFNKGEVEPFTSNYILTAGRNNLGAFTHVGKNAGKFTKISRFSHRDTKREKEFYEKISKFNLYIEEVVPKYINSRIKDNILYLTTELVEEAPVNQDSVKDVIDASLKIASIRYQDVIDEHPNPNYMFQMRNRPISIVIFFTKIHKKEYNEQLFKMLKVLMDENNYPKSVFQVIAQLESLIMDNSLYVFIEPEEHYSLLHGDYIPSNVKLDLNDNKIKVYDWATFTTGPHFVDIARYLSARLISYQEINEIYLSNKETGGKLSLIEKIFFHYALILLYILRLKEKEVESRLNDCIYPALNSLKKLVNELNVTDYTQAVSRIKGDEEALSKKVIKLEEETKKLKKQISKLKKDNKKMETRHRNIINSKSWRLTEPLRRIMKQRKKR